MSDYRKSLHNTSSGFPFVEICSLALLTDPQGNLLLMRNRGDIYWHLPEGWLTPRETIEECLQRSVLENCAILLENCLLLKVFSGQEYSYVTEDTANVTPVYMLLYPRRIRGSLRTAPRDGAEIRFFAPWNIPIERIFPPMRNVIRYFIDHYSETPPDQSTDWERYPEILA